MHLMIVRVILKTHFQCTQCNLNQMFVDISQYYEQKVHLLFCVIYRISQITNKRNLNVIQPSGLSIIFPLMFTKLPKSYLPFNTDTSVAPEAEKRQL